MAKEKAKEREKRSKREERKVKRKQSRVSLETHSKPARACARRCPPCTCTYDEAGAAVDEIVGNCFGAAGDIDLWAWYCRHFDFWGARLRNGSAAITSLQFNKQERGLGKGLRYRCGLSFALSTAATGNLTAMCF